MRQIKAAAAICLASSMAAAQSGYRLAGSDILKRYTERLLSALGLEAPPPWPNACYGDQYHLHYVGGGSRIGLEILAGGGLHQYCCCQDPACSMHSCGAELQLVAPSSRFVNATEVSEAAARGLQFIDHTLALDGVVIHVNDAGNPALGRLKFSDAGKIWRCEWVNWSQVPGSDRTDGMTVIALDEFSGTTDNFVSQITNFNQNPPDSWWNNYPCVTVCRPGPEDNCTELIGTITAADPTSIAFTGLPGLRSGNRDLALCNDTNPPMPSCSDSDYVFQNATT